MDWRWRHQKSWIRRVWHFKQANSHCSINKNASIHSSRKLCFFILFYLRNRIPSSCGSSLRLCRALLNDGKRSITIASRVQLQQQRNGVIGSTKVWLSFHWLIIYDDHPRYFFPFNSDQQERPRTLLTKQPLKICIRSIEIYKRTTAKFPPKKTAKMDAWNIWQFSWICGF